MKLGLQPQSCVYPQPDRDVWGRCWEGPKHRSFWPRGVGARHPPSMWTCSPTYSFPDSHTFGIFMEVLSHRCDQVFTESPALLPPLENGEWGENPSLGSQLGLSDDQPPPRSPPRVASSQ